MGIIILNKYIRAIPENKCNGKALFSKRKHHPYNFRYCSIFLLKLLTLIRKLEERWILWKKSREFSHFTIQESSIQVEIKITLKNKNAIYSHKIEGNEYMIDIEDILENVTCMCGIHFIIKPCLTEIRDQLP